MGPDPSPLKSSKGFAHDRKDVSCISCHSVHNYKSVRSQVKAQTGIDLHPEVRIIGEPA